MTRKYVFGFTCAVLALSASLAPATLVTNGTFDADTDWTKVGTAGIGGGRATLGAGGNNRGAVYQTINTVANRWYKVTYDKGHAGSVNLPSGLMVTAFDGAGNANANGYWGQSHVAPDKTGVTAWFQAQSNTTTLQFRDFNYSGASHDVRVDNVSVVAGTVGTRDEVNIAHSAALSQSSYYDAGSYPAAYGVDGVANNFMHTNTNANQTYTMTFDEDKVITRVAISSREASFRNRVGKTLQLYDAADTLIDTVTINDNYYNDLKKTPGWWGVRKIVVQETAQTLNFAEIEVFTAQQVNIASLGSASASSVHGSFGADPARAIDGSGDFASSGTVFHSRFAGGDWWMLDLDSIYTLHTVEIQARTGFTSRIGSLLEFLDINGNVLTSEAINTNDATPGGLWTLSGDWRNVAGVRITENDNETLNLAEVRLFAYTVVPEPMTLLAVGLSITGLGRYVRKRRTA